MLFYHIGYTEKKTDLPSESYSFAILIALDEDTSGAWVAGIITSRIASLRPT